MMRRATTRRQLRSFQDAAVRRLVRHAYDNVRYYRRLFDLHSIRPDHVRTVDDLRIVPITTKADLRDLPPGDVVARGLDPERLVSITTSGSSGEPFTIRRSPAEQRRIIRTWIWAERRMGLRLGDKHAAVIFMGHGRDAGPGLARRMLARLGIGREALVDCCLPPEQILKALADYGPDFIMGYPGLLAHLGELMGEADRSRIRPRAVRVTGEVLTDLLRGQIREAFGAPVYDTYASHELNPIGWECPQTGELHTFGTAAIAEVLADGRAAEPGEQGVLVGTNLRAYAMPFIRYGLGDLVVQGSPACPCGEPVPTLRQVSGREIDYFVTPDGRLVHPFPLIGAMLKAADWIRRYRLVQEAADRIVAYITPTGEPTPEQVARVRQALLPMLGPGVGLETRLTPHIEVGPRGKYRPAMCLVRHPADAGQVRAGGDAPAQARPSPARPA